MTPEESAKLYAKPLVERLADLEHQQWMQWARTLMEKEPGLSPERRARWQTLMVPFDEHLPLAAFYAGSDRAEGRFD